MMWLLAALYHDLPEVGDVDKPKLVFFFDEAHLLFDDASKALLDQIEQVVRLIRSKGVGVFFVTQSPKDVPATCSASSGIGCSTRCARSRRTTRRRCRAAARTFPEDDVLRHRGDADVARHRRGARHRARRRGVPTPPFATRLSRPRRAWGRSRRTRCRPTSGSRRGSRSTARRWIGKARARCWPAGWSGRRRPRLHPLRLGEDRQADQDDRVGGGWRGGGRSLELDRADDWTGGSAGIVRIAGSQAGVGDPTEPVVRAPPPAHSNASFT